MFNTSTKHATQACLLQSALLISTPFYKLVPSLQAQGCVPKLIHNLGVKDSVSSLLQFVGASFQRRMFAGQNAAFDA